MASKKKDEKEKSNSVQVGVRIRPVNPKEMEADMRPVFKPAVGNVGVQEIVEDGVGKVWNYDHVFGDDCDNEHVFNTLAKPLVASALEGYNTVLFMYGQTSSGKTFTLFGAEGTRGLVDHSLEEVYKGVHAAEEQEFVIKMIFAELYNEELRDLLHDGETDPPKLGITDDPVLGPQIHNITEKSFTTVEDMRRLLDEGDKRRQFGVTNMNAHSSRSHVLVRLNIESRRVEKKSANPLRLSWGKDKPNCYSTLNLVDLAGSERAKKSGTSGQSFKEGSFINKSLLNLGTVISNLSEGKSLKHITYRNSKLTRLLSSALGGNAKTCMITCISPASGNIQESISTLRFASRAKRIVNHAAKNELDDAHSLKLKLGKQSDEIAELRAKLEGGAFYGAEELKEKANRAKRNFQSLRFLISSSSSVIKALNRCGKYDLAKRVREDVRGVLEGSRNMDDVLENQKDLLDTHLATEEKITARHRRFDRALTRDITEDDEVDDAISDCESELSTGMVEALDSEELLEECSRAHMSAEDITARYINDVSALKAENRSLENKCKSLEQDMTDKSLALADSQTDLQRVTSERNDLSKKYDKLMKKTGEDEALIREDLQNFEKQLKGLEGIIKERDSTIAEKDNEIESQSEEITNLQRNSDQLSKDLKEAIRMRQSFEDEAKRSKNELRMQVERLRSNMSNMLQQGDQESKVLENQNQFLFNDLRQAQDEKDSLQTLNSQMSEEMKYLRQELAKSQEECKGVLKEFQHLRNETFHDHEKVKMQALELDKWKAKLKAVHKDYEDLKDQSSEEILQQSQEIAKLEAAINDEKSSSTKKVRELKEEVSLLQAQLSNEKEAFDAKECESKRMEQKTNFELKRYEKKLSEMNKDMEALQKQHNSSASRYKQKIHSQLDEITELKCKIQELENTIQSVEDFVSNEVDGGGLDYESADESHRYYNDDESMQYSYMDEDEETTNYERTPCNSWQSNRSGSPITSAILGKSRERTQSISSPKASSVSKTYTSTASRLAATFPVETSSKAKSLMVALKTVSASFDCMSRKEVEHSRSLHKELSKSRDRYHALVTDHQRISQEIFTLQHLRERTFSTLEEFQNREEGLSSRLKSLEAELQDSQSELRTLKSKEDCALTKLPKLKFECEAIKSRYENSRQALKDLEADHKKLGALYEEMEQALKEKSEENTLLLSDLDAMEQKVAVVEAERDEIIRQYCERGKWSDKSGGEHKLKSVPSKGSVYRSPIANPHTYAYYD